MRLIVNGEVKVYINENGVAENRKIRDSPNLYVAKSNVKKRDKVCQCCGESDKILECHHIFPLSAYKDLACKEDNMILLCQSCHKRYHNRYEKVNPVTFSEFMKNNGKVD